MRTTELPAQTTMTEVSDPRATTAPMNSGGRPRIPTRTALAVEPAALSLSPRRSRTTIQATWMARKYATAMAVSRARRAGGRIAQAIAKAPWTVR
jgi:hypothetical protein